MTNAARNRRLNQLMRKEINEQCAKYEEECRFLGSHKETEEEKQARLNRKRCEELHKNRWTLHR